MLLLPHFLLRLLLLLFSLSLSRSLLKQNNKTKQNKRNKRKQLSILIQRFMPALNHYYYSFPLTLSLFSFFLCTFIYMYI